MSEEHIPIPEGWLDPQFRGGAGAEPDPVSMAYPDLMPPGGPGVGPGMKPAGVGGMVHAGEMAAPIPAPVTTPAGGIAVGTGRGSSLYRRPAGSSPDGPLVQAGDAWVSVPTSGVRGGDEPVQSAWDFSGFDDQSDDSDQQLREGSCAFVGGYGPVAWDPIQAQRLLPAKWPPDWWPKWGVIPTPFPVPHGIPFPYFPRGEKEEVAHLTGKLSELRERLTKLEKEETELNEESRKLIQEDGLIDDLFEFWDGIKMRHELTLDGELYGGSVYDFFKSLFEFFEERARNRAAGFYPAATFSDWMKSTIKRAIADNWTAREIKEALKAGWAAKVDDNTSKLSAKKSEIKEVRQKIRDTQSKLNQPK